MTLPPSLRFPLPGFWGLHVIVIPSVFAGGITLGIFHATNHGAGVSDVHAEPPAGSHAHTAAPKASGPTADNPIRDEMVALQRAYDTLNRAVILGNGTGVAEAFHVVHTRKQATAAAIGAGTAKPPRNADRMDAFAARDEAFHALLETTVEAAERNDIPTLKRMSAALQDGCIGCHEEFRGSPQ